MPDGPPRLDRWRRLGRLLPSDVRERVFEPALGDLMYEHLTDPPSRSRIFFGVRALGTYLGCVSPALRNLLVNRGRLTRLGRASLLGVTLVTAVALWLARYGRYDSGVP